MCPRGSRGDSAKILDNIQRGFESLHHLQISIKFIKMKEQFVTYEIALKLKELGFDEPCLAFYQGSKDLVQKKPFLKNSKQIYYGQDNIGVKESPSMNVNNCTAPLWQQAFIWLLKKLDFNYPYLHLEIFLDGSGEWKAIEDESGMGGMSIGFDNLEQGILEGIKQL